MFKVLNDLFIEIRAKYHCRKISFGSYKCYKKALTIGTNCDKCLVEEINFLNKKGVTTIGCCCGHGKAQGYIQVYPKYCDLIESFGYKKRPHDKYKQGEQGVWCYIPKTKLPSY